MSKLPERPLVVMYVKPWCPYCTAARALLHAKGVHFSETDISDAPHIRADLIRRTGRQTVPQIFVGDVHVGGYDDMAALDRQGKLDSLLGL